MIHSPLAAAAPPPWTPRVVLLLVLLPTVVLAAHDESTTGDLDYDDSDEQEHKDVSTYNGHSLVLDLSSLSVLAALKLKFVVVLLVVAAVYMLMTKSYKTQCLFGSCRPNYSTYGYYPYVDYTYVGYEVPAASSRRPLAAAGLGSKDSPQLSDLTARVWNSIDIAGMAFSALNIQEDDCRRKLVCQADRAASANPILRAALSWFSPSLARYRTDRSRPEDGAELPWLRELGDPCEDMYPQCRHRDLPPALGGPEPLGAAVYLEEHRGGPHLEQHGDHLLQLQHQQVQSPGEQTWQPSAQSPATRLYGHEYQYEVTQTHPIHKQSYRLAGAAGAPPPPSATPLHLAEPARHGAAVGLGQKRDPEDDIAILDGSAASPEAVAAVAAVAPQLQDGAAAAGRSPSLGAGVAGASWVGGGDDDQTGASASPAAPPEPRSRVDTAAAPAPQVWRRMVLGPPGIKAHRD